MKFVLALVPALFVAAAANAIEVGDSINISRTDIQCVDVPASGGNCSYCYDDGGYGYGYRYGGRLRSRAAHADIKVTLQNTDGVTQLAGRTTTCAAFEATLSGATVTGKVTEKNVKDIGSVKSVMLGVLLQSSGVALTGYGEI